jgi:nicotinamide phosphoribosyltransferase
MQRGIWYPSTIATADRVFLQELEKIYKETGADLSLLPFALHDFGGRGVTSGESAQIGGAAHLANFAGSDTIEGIIAANFYYNEKMAAYSVYATEHSVQCSYGKEPEQQIEYIRHQLKEAKKLELPIISIVLDGYDVYREAEACCTVLRDEIIESGVKVVFRPDSGDMEVVVPRLLRLQAATFGYTLNSKGLKKIKHVGIIQGDGVDRPKAINLLHHIIALGFAPDNVIFGSGGGLLQKVNRDTYKWAQKASAILKDDKWIGIAKDPITDPGKKSEEGVLTVLRDRYTGELMTGRLDNIDHLDEQWEDIMVLVYHCGKLYNETTLKDIRARVRS